MSTFTGTAPLPRNDVLAAARPGSWPLVLVAALLFLPSAIRYFLGTSSNTLGLLAASLLLCGAASLRGGFVRGSFARRSFGVSLIIVFCLVLHLGVAVFFPRVPQVVEFSRTIASLMALIATAITAGVVADWLMQAKTLEIDRVGHIVRILLVLIGIWCFLGTQPPSPLMLARPTFPFTEPSHYAIVAAPFLVDGCVRTTLPRRLVWLAIWTAIGLLNQSLSLLVAVTIAALVSLPIAYAIISAIPIAAVAGGIDLQYYLDRLDFSEKSTNLSSLVYRQGWELLQQGLTYSRGWGIGFQQLGFAPLNVPTSDLIYRILGDDSNLRDGSFLAAKLVSELGVIGIAIVFVFILAVLRTAWRLRAMAAMPGRLQQANVRFAAASVCAFATEMFVRGIGYFSSTVIIVVAAAMVLRSSRLRSSTA